MSKPCCPLSKNMLTLITPRGSTVKSIGSDTMRAPFGILNDVEPLNVTFRSVSGWILLTPEELFPGSATVTAEMGRVVVPKTLVKRKRKKDPPSERCRVCRIVAFSNIAADSFCENRSVRSEWSNG